MNKPAKAASSLCRPLRRRFGSVAGTSPALSPAALADRTPVTCEMLEGRRMLSTTIDITTSRAQTIDGFGTSLGGQTAVSLVKTQKFQKAYYRDLGASMFRVALNPWTLRGTTKNGGKSMGVPVNMGPHIEENIRQFNWDSYNIQKYGSMARGAIKYGQDVKVIGSFWSPPYWMKGEEISAFDGKPKGVMPKYNDANGNTSGGSLIDTEENLTQFGRYVSAYVKGFEKQFGVPLYAISIQNELAFHEYYSSAVYSPELYVKAVKAVHRWFNYYGIETKIMGPEDVGVGSTDNTGILNRQMAYIKALRKDPDAMDAVDLFAIHGYANDGVTPQRSAEMWSRYWNGYDGTNERSTFDGIKLEKKRSYMTEVSGYGSTWDQTMRFAGSIQDMLVHGNTSGYVYWGISNTYDNGEALMVADDFSANKVSALKHFAKYVRPDSVRLKTDGGDHDGGVYASAYVNDADRTLTGVLINDGNATETVTLKLGDTGVAAFRTVYMSNSKRTWRAQDAMRVRNGRVTFDMPAKSIFTLVGSTSKTGVPDGTISGVYFADTNKNGVQDKTEKGLGGDKVFLDLNANGTRDRREPTVVTNAKGAFAFTGLPKGNYRVRRELVSGFAMTTEPTLTRIKKGSINVGGLALGVASTKTAPPSVGRTAGISGRAFSDTNADGKQTGTEPNAVGKTVFLDTDADGKLDAGEKRTTTDANGNFRFTNLAAGTYRVRRVFPQGFTYSKTPITLTLKAGEQETGLLIGGRAI